MNLSFLALNTNFFKLPVFLRSALHKFRAHMEQCFLSIEDRINEERHS